MSNISIARFYAHWTIDAFAKSGESQTSVQHSFKDFSHCARGLMACAEKNFIFYHEFFTHDYASAVRKTRIDSKILEFETYF